MLKIIRRIRLLPLVMALGSFLLGLQLITLGQALLPSRAVASDQKADAAPAPVVEKASDAATVDSVGIDDPGVSRSETVLLGDLARRRRGLEEREQALLMRERLLEATEKRVDDRINELKTLETGVKSLIVQYEDQENGRMADLVGVYERMKPKDAARILEKLELDVQVKVAQRMKQTKFAPVLAAMSSEAATTLTTKLAERPESPVAAALAETKAQ